MQWWTGLQPNVQAALIAAAVTLLGVVIRDLVFGLWRERREHRRSTIGIYRQYADPLASAAGDLLWRLHEIHFHEGRGTYLLESRTIFERYKQASTLYRLASLLGWIRAFRRELSFLRVGTWRRLEAVEEAIHSLESALADGPQIERERVEGLAALWRLPLPQGRDKDLLGIALSNVLKPLLESAQVRLATELPPELQHELCRQAAQALCRGLEIEPVPEATLVETQSRAMERLAIREAWLYRDWQAGIGDLMIRDSRRGGRAFEVIGFREFETILLSDDEADRRWLSRLSAPLEGLDVSADEKTDARVLQLRQTLLAVAKLIAALSRVERRRQIVPTATLATAEEILRDRRLASVAANA